ncbi:hypothetical protein HDU90_001877 [Geranomyces variabilis]|nr:hypothetical protein HDU90_001877 [Geranomyces variabilis]
MADMTFDDFRGADADRRAAFVAGGSLDGFLKARNIHAVWNSAMPPPESIAAIAAEPNVMSLLRLIVKSGNVGDTEETAAVRAAFANFENEDEDYGTPSVDNEDPCAYILYLRQVRIKDGSALAQVLAKLATRRPIDAAYERLLNCLGWSDCQDCISLWYIGSTYRATLDKRMANIDETRVQVLVDVARSLDVLSEYTGKILLRRPLARGAVPSATLQHLETTMRLALGPIALNCAPGGRDHLVQVSPETAASLGHLSAEHIAGAVAMLEQHGFKGDGESVSYLKDSELKDALALAYRDSMPHELRREMTAGALEMAIRQSTELQTFFGQIVSVTLGKDITVEAFHNLIPFFGKRSGPGPRLIASAETTILGSANTREFLRIVARGPFHDLWEVLSHTLWKEARLWLASWLHIVRPLTTFAMGKAPAKALYDFLPVEKRPPSKVPFFHLVGRPTVVPMNGSATILIACMDPGKAKYNSLTSPFEIELVTICKAIHVLAATIVTELIVDHCNGQAESTMVFLTNRALPRLLSAMNEPGGLTFARNRVCRQLARLYSTAEGCEGTVIANRHGDQGFGVRSADMKKSGVRRSLPTLGEPFSPQRRDQLASLQAAIQRHADLGEPFLIPDLLPCLSFGDIGDAAWQTFVLSSAAAKDLWEAAKSYGKHGTDGMSAAEKKAYAAKRFVRTSDAAATLAALRAHNDTCVRKIGAPGYAWSKANDRIYLHKCDTCGEFFLANAKGQGGDLKTHGHSDGETVADGMNRRKVSSINEIRAALVVLVAAAKLSPLNELTDVVQTNVPGAAAPVSLLLVKGSMLNNDELEFLALLEFTRVTAMGESAKISSTKALDSVASAIASDSSLRWYSCTACGEQALRAANRKQQHKCLTPRPYMHPVANTPSISSFEQLPATYRLALLAEAVVPGQLVEQTLRSARLDWRTVTSWKVGESRASLLPSPAPTPTKSKRARNNYSENYAKLDNLQAAQTEPLGDAQIRQELLTMGLTAAQAKTAKTGWVKRARKN